MSLDDCSGSAKVSGNSQSGVSGEVSVGCRIIRKVDETEQASLWDRFRNTLVAYTPSSIAEVDFSKLSLAIGVAGGQLGSTVPDLHIKLFDSTATLISERAFSGNINNGILKLSNPSSVKYWAQNFENTIASFSVSSDALELSQTYETVTLTATAYNGSISLGSVSGSYSSGGDCSRCDDQTEIK